MATNPTFIEPEGAESASVLETKTTAFASKTKAQRSRSLNGTPSPGLDINQQRPASGDARDEQITELESSISTLWSEHLALTSDAKKSKQALHEARLKLGERLSDLKARLAGTGRKGGWARYLREQRIPLPTADRYVENYRKAQAGPKLLSEELSDVTPEQVKQFARKVAGTVKRTLKKPENREAFLQELTSLLDRSEQQP